VCGWGEIERHRDCFIYPSEMCVWVNEQAKQIEREGKVEKIAGDVLVSGGWRRDCYALHCTATHCIHAFRWKGQLDI